MPWRSRAPQARPLSPRRRRSHRATQGLFKLRPRCGHVRKHRRQHPVDAPKAGTRPLRELARGPQQVADDSAPLQVAPGDPVRPHRPESLAAASGSPTSVRWATARGCSRLPRRAPRSSFAVRVPSDRQTRLSRGPRNTQRASSGCDLHPLDQKDALLRIRRQPGACGSGFPTRRARVRPGSSRRAPKARRARRVPRDRRPTRPLRW